MFLFHASSSIYFKWVYYNYAENGLFVKLQMLLEPLNELKKADGRLNLTQGVLEGVCM